MNSDGPTKLRKRLLSQMPDPFPGEGSKVLNRLPQLAEALLHFDLREEGEQLRREDSWQRETGRSSKTLAKFQISASFWS